ncbi:MAG TPA: hypothetical protein VGI95_03785 [Caulobacteraceae bacterium]|jgi:hypothetical protein
MKHAVLTSVAHNIADSLASGCGLLIGRYEMDVFGEAGRAPEGFIEVNFLTGVTTGAPPSRYLAEAIALYVEVLPQQCEKHGISVADFQTLTTRYSEGPFGAEFIVEVRDRMGRRSIDRYVGSPGSRPKLLDSLGRIRRLRRGRVA